MCGVFLWWHICTLHHQKIISKKLSVFCESTADVPENAVTYQHICYHVVTCRKGHESAIYIIQQLDKDKQRIVVNVSKALRTILVV